MTSPHTHPAERETPAGEAMREAVARTLCSEWGYLWDGDPHDDDQVVAEDDGDLLDRPSKALFRRGADAILTGPIASELARVTAERDAAREEQRAMLIQVGKHARARGEAEGALAVSEKAGIVEGWRDRALAATPPEDRQTEAAP